MEIHKPKAVHGWRELLKEIGIIVIGVLIALGAEQAVDSVHWMHEVDTGKEVLKADFVREAQNAAKRDTQSPCIAQRLAFLSTVLQNATETGRLPALKALGHPPYTPWTIGSWPALVASQTIGHLPRNQMISYTVVEQITGFLSDESDREEAQWTILDTMSGPGRRLSDTEAEQLRTVLAEASTSNALMHRSADTMRRFLRNTGLVEPALFDAAMRQALHDKASAPICRALALPLPHDTKANPHG